MNHQRTIVSQTNLSSLFSCPLCSLSLPSEPLLAMEDPLLAAHLQSLLDKLAPGPLMDFAIQEGFDSELRKWRSMLRKIKPVLGDAEQKQMNDREVKRWLHDLLVLAYDADDALDDLGCEALQQQNNSSSAPATSCSQLPDMLPLIKKITARFQDIEEQKSDLELDAKHGVRSSIINKRSETTSLLDTSEIVGRENDVEAILKLMRLSETTKAKAHASHTFGMAGSGSGSINKLGKLKDSLGMEAPSSETIVIPIVGPGGVGKTTLAKCIYNHEKVENCFDLKVWACVSDTFDILGVTKAILEKVDRDAKDLNTLNALQERLKKKISWQSFLVVLDDIWTEKYEEWKNLFIPFKEGRTRSVVIVTTRSEKVAKNTRTTSPYHLDLLRHDECVSIFAQHALGAKDFSGHSDLKDIGQEIVRKCNGLPLAAATLGGLLRNEDLMKWKEVCDSSLWNRSISETIIPALGLSYHYLSPQLKRCFAYFSLFPKDNEFDKEELILLWMAEGFLVEPNAHKQMEDLGHEYFCDLLSRSLLQQSRAQSRKFVMHDLVHDLAQTVAGRVCFRMEDKEEAKVVDTEAVCHLSVCPLLFLYYVLEPKFEVLKNTNRLRTLLLLSLRSFYINQVLILDLLPQLRHLRVLSLNYRLIQELPNSIGNLKHLRYLDLSESSIKFLPHNLCDLHSLQFLILKGCYNLQQLPLRLKDLANLRYLDISGTCDQQGLPSHVLDLKFFQKLTKFVVGRRFPWSEDVVYHLPGGLSIWILDKVGDVEDAFVINLMSKKNIENLEFVWLRDVDNNGNAERQFQILNLLEPGKMLRNLVIRRYRGVTLPNWIGDSSYSELVELSLIDCKRCKLLPSLGQLPQLQKLTIEGMLEIETMGTELYGEASPHGQPFPSLTELRIKSCKNLRTLPDGIMSSNSNLQVLEIRYCESLESLGSGVLPSTLKKLEISYCRKLESISEMLLGPTSLDHIEFVGNPNLKSLPECLCTNLTYLCVNECESIESFPEIPNLAVLEIRYCENLKYLPSNLPKLTYLRIDGCESIESFPETPNLADLEIHYCENLKYLPTNLPKLTALKHLCVAGCDNLVSLPEGGLPPGLQDLVFVACAKVEKQMWDEWAPYNLPCLTSLSIEGDFRDVVCFPIPAQESQSRLPPSLTSLSIGGFSNLESLSSSAFRNLTSLAELWIDDCPKLQSLPIEALPPSLLELFIVKCPELMPKCEEEGGEYWPRLSLIPNVRIDEKKLVKNGHSNQG